MLWQLKTSIGRGQLGQGYRATTCIAYLHSLQMCNHAMPNPPIGSASAALSQRRLGDGGAALESGPYGVPAPLRRTRSSSSHLLASFVLPRQCSSSSSIAQRPEADTAPRQDLTNPPSFVIDRSPSQTYQAQQNVATGLHLQSDFGLCFYFYHVPKQILLELFVNDS
jgi:hypothetical protein